MVNLRQKVALAAAGLAGIIGSAQASTIDVAQDITQNSEGTYFLTDITNNSGVTINSGTIDYSALLSDLANLDWNKSSYENNADNIIDSAELANFVSYLESNDLMSILIDSDSPVYDGWEISIGNTGTASITGSGFEESWDSGETLMTYLSIANSVLTNPSTSTIVGTSVDTSKTIEDFVKLSEGGAGGLNFSASGNGYNVAVPEPETIGLGLGTLALGLALYKRRHQKSPMQISGLSDSCGNN